MSDLKAELEAISGIGPAKADKIMELVEAENTENPYIPEEYAKRLEENGQWLTKAYDALENGDEERALTYLKRSQ